MVGHGGSSAGSYLTDPTSPIPYHCASIVMTSTLRVKRSQTVTGLCGVYQHSLLSYYVNSLSLLSCESISFVSGFVPRIEEKSL